MKETISRLTELLLQMKVEGFAIEYYPYDAGDTRSFAIFAGSLIAEARTLQEDFDKVAWERVIEEVNAGELRKDLPWFFEMHNAIAKTRQLFGVQFNNETCSWCFNKIFEM